MLNIPFYVYFIFDLVRLFVFFFINRIKNKLNIVSKYNILLYIFNKNYNTVYKIPTLENFFLSFGSRYLFLNLKFLGVTSNNSSELI